MRWVVSIVTAVCLLAAVGDARGPRRTDATHDTQLEKATGVPAYAVARRQASHNDVRLPVFAIVDAPSLEHRPPTASTNVDQVSVRSPLARAPSVSSRGPPRG